MTGLEGGGLWDDSPLEYPAFAPFTAAGYFVAHAGFLHEVPFDPFLPWIFMGEEIIMSTRLWTSGYDIFSPSRSVVGHMYVRRHKPKVSCLFSENLARFPATFRTLKVLWLFFESVFSFGRVYIGKIRVAIWKMPRAGKVLLTLIASFCLPQCFQNGRPYTAPNDDP